MISGLPFLGFGVHPFLLLPLLPSGLDGLELERRAVWHCGSEVMPTALTGEDYQKRLPARESAGEEQAERVQVLCRTCALVLPPSCCASDPCSRESQSRGVRFLVGRNFGVPLRSSSALSAPPGQVRALEDRGDAGPESQLEGEHAGAPRR